MRRILLYGDSNTWGYTPGSGARLAERVRWPGVLAAALGSDYCVTEEGLNGRTTVFDDPFEKGKNGKTYLEPCLASHRPLNLVVTMLGTNDLKHRFGLSAFDIGEGIRYLAELVLASKAGPAETQPQLLIIAPPHLNPEGLGEAFEGGVEKSHLLARYYLRVAEELGCFFLDAAAQVSSSPVDGVHLDESAHRDLGVAVAERVREMFPFAPTPEMPAHEPLDTQLAHAITHPAIGSGDAQVRAKPGSESVAEGVSKAEPDNTASLTGEEREKVQAMRSSVGKLTVALGERGKGKQAREVLESHGFDPDTTDLELGRRVYVALREVLKG